MAVDFSKTSSFTEDAGIVQVKWGSGATVLEVELDEVQEIQRARLQKFLKTYVGDGTFDKGTMELIAGTFSVENETFVVDGELIDVDLLYISMGDNQSVYLDVFDKEVTYEDDLPKYGNEQKVTLLNNNILDERIGTETSRRKVLAYKLSNTNIEEGHKYLLLGKTVGGVFTREVKSLMLPTKGFTWGDLKGV